MMGKALEDVESRVREQAPAPKSRTKCHLCHRRYQLNDPDPVSALSPINPDVDLSIALEYVLVLSVDVFPPPVIYEPADDGTVLPVNEDAIAATATLVSESHDRFHQPPPSFSTNSATAHTPAVLMGSFDGGASAKSTEEGWSEVDG